MFSVKTSIVPQQGQQFLEVAESSAVLNRFFRIWSIFSITRRDQIPHIIGAQKLKIVQSESNRAVISIRIRGNNSLPTFGILIVRY